MGFFAIKHTDGNIMPILEQIVECGPDAAFARPRRAAVTIPLCGDHQSDALIGNVKPRSAAD